MKTTKQTTRAAKAEKAAKPKAKSAHKAQKPGWLLKDFMDYRVRLVGGPF